MVCNKSIFLWFFSKKLKKHQMSTTSQFWVDLSWLVCVALSFAWCLFTMFWSKLHFGMKTKCSGIWLPFQSCFKTWFEPNTGQGLLLKESGFPTCFCFAYQQPSMFQSSLGTTFYGLFTLNISNQCQWVNIFVDQSWLCL